MAVVERTTFLGKYFTTGVKIKVPRRRIDPMMIVERYSLVLEN